MKKILLVLFSIWLFVGFSFAQKVKPTPQPIPQNNFSAIEISQTDWNNLSKEIAAENWKKVETISLEYLKKLPKENAKKQIAQLNYIYIFALEGQVAKGDLDFDDFGEILQTFIGKEFLMPSRQILASCKKVLNYICPSKDEEKTLFISATNSSSTVIHSFEYYQLNDAFDINKYKSRIVFLSGTLSKFLLNPQKNNIWIARLYFGNTKIDIVK